MDLIIAFLIFAAGLFLIIKSASYAVSAIINYAEKTGLSKYFVGLLIVSIGTSLPELFTGIISALNNNTALIAGNAIGATIVDVTLILGFVAIIAKSMKIDGKIVHISIPKIMLIVIMPLILGIDGTLSRIDGIILLSVFTLYYVTEIWNEIKTQKLRHVKWKHIWEDILLFGLNIGLLLFGAQLLVTSSTFIASYFEIPMYLFGAVFLAICTTSPEFIVELKAIRKGSIPIAFGNIFGSVVTNTSLVLGLAAIINPFTLDRGYFTFTNAWMILAVSLGLHYIKKGKITRTQGYLLSSLFVIYLIINLVVF